ncbi:hypothetical protein [Pantoea sp. 18069]|uniref:hypothetical protein n=1 Tax=Pantoea sp. 18069 TaxID=2681415 RepID=UPI001357A0A7|nr:hypothetical protein [Pantoea sp. 18069]
MGKRKFAQANTLGGKERIHFNDVIHQNKIHEAIAGGNLSDLEDLTLTSEIKNPSQKK